MSTILITGASRGLGRALALGLAREGDTLLLVSRSDPGDLGLDGSIGAHWIEADLRKPDAHLRIAHAVADRPLDALVLNAGVWERGWTATPFEDVTDDEIRDIITVNLTSRILLARALIPALRRSDGARIIQIASTSALDNEGSTTVAFNASNAGQRRMAQSLRALLREDRIGVATICPGSIAAGSPGVAGAGRIPADDLVRLVRAVLDTSPDSCVGEIVVPAMDDTDV